MQGKVVQRAECCPITSDLYSSIKKDALTKAGEPRRMLKQLDKHVTTTFKPIANHAGNVAYAKAKKAEGKKTRDDKDKVPEIILALFEKHQFYNIKYNFINFHSHCGRFSDIVFKKKNGEHAEWFFGRFNPNIHSQPFREPNAC